eukprot:COSAG05_NODE_13505_length_427_cov_1.060976_1_plen_113_part_01
MSSCRCRYRLFNEERLVLVARTYCIGTAEYSRYHDGNEGKWLLSFAPETAVGANNCGTMSDDNGQAAKGYSVALTVSEESLLRPFEELASKIVGGVVGAAIVVSVVVAVGMLI